MRIISLALCSAIIAFSGCAAKSVKQFPNVDGSKYTGAMDKGQFHGKGKLSYPNGTLYQGQFQQGQYHGNGQLTSDDFDYEGQFKQGLMHGEGTMTLADGSIYQGEFVEGELVSGSTQNDYSSYEGEFKNYAYHGQGKLDFLEHGYYQGEFANGQFHGKGQYFDAQGGGYSGTFEYGELVGTAYYTNLSQGLFYIGEMQRFKYHGEGELTTPEGHYQGEFRAGKFHGTGTFTAKDGSVQTGYFQSGDFVGEPPAKHADELAWQNHGVKLQSAINNLKRSKEGIKDRYFLGIAAYGNQGVFQREVKSIAALFAAQDIPSN